MITSGLYACGLEDYKEPRTQGKKEKLFQSQKSANRQQKKEQWLKKQNKSKQKAQRKKRVNQTERKETRLLQNKEPLNPRKKICKTTIDYNILIYLMSGGAVLRGFNKK